MGGKIWRWGVILDAGSSGTRLHIYRWKNPTKVIKHATVEELNSLPQLETKEKWTKKIRPGVSTYGETPTAVGPEYLQKLVDHALQYIPEDKTPETPIFVMATAGLRLLPQTQQTALTREICIYLQANTGFSLPDCGLHVQVIQGETEGLYGWIASNYLLGAFDHPDEQQDGKDYTYGFLDMGGASAQIAFAPNSTEAEKHSNDLKLLRLRTMNGRPLEYKVFTATWLGFGVNQARESYIKSLEETYGANVTELPDPCLPKGLRTSLQGQLIKDSTKAGRSLLGTGSFDECLQRTYPLLYKDALCDDAPCLLNGQHVPAIDFDVNHFIGVSEYWHTTHGVFADEKKPAKAFNFATYENRVKLFCSQDWTWIEANGVERMNKKLKNSYEACFKASWLINVLHEGIGLPKTDLGTTAPAVVNASKAALESGQEKVFIDAFTPLDKFHDMEISWTLGKMLLYASGQIPPRSGTDSLPVGFGANVAGTPPDFQLAGSSWKPVHQDDDDDDNDWGDTAGDLLGKATKNSLSGILVFVVILVLLAYFFSKRERRLRVLGRYHRFLCRSCRPISPRKGRGGLFILTNKLFGRHPATYERIMEEGNADQFELRNADSDDTDQSDSTEGSRLARSSGLATPTIKVDMFEPMVASGSVLGRNGFLKRAESRERLGLGSQHLGGSGGRSRSTNVSPSRM